MYICVCIYMYCVNGLMKYTSIKLFLVKDKESFVLVSQK